MVDHQKKVLWALFDSPCSSHDSTAFRNFALHSLSVSKAEALYGTKKILRDSAYAIESFILPPYDNAGKNSVENSYNFYHFSARITVECDFGEIDLRWEIFERDLHPLSMTISKS